MVFPIIIQIGSQIVRAVVRYNRYEARLFKKAYRGVDRNVARGIRHGYVAGSVIGSAFSPVDYGEAPSERSSDIKRKARNNMVKPRGERIYNQSYSSNDRTNTSKRKCRCGRSYWR